MNNRRAMVATEPTPPRHAVACPTEHRHARIAVREDWFYCGNCDRRFDAALDLRSGREIPHAEFADRWGTGVFDRTF